MQPFELFRPTSLAKALDLFRESDGEAVYLSGGTDLLVKYRHGKLAPRAMISLRTIPGLDGISEEDDRLIIGAGATLRELETSALITERFPILHDALSHMASVQIRNTATMAGNIANAAPSADTAPPMLALGASVQLSGPTGQREVALKDFFLGPSRTVMEPGEILTGFVVPKPSGPAGGGYAKVSRRKAMDLAILGVAVQIEFEADKETCQKARIALGVAGPTPRRSPEAEAALAGKRVTEENLKAVCNLAAGESACRTSLRGEAWYRREMIRVQVKRMALLAKDRAK